MSQYYISCENQYRKHMKHYGGYNLTCWECGGIFCFNCHSQHTCKYTSLRSLVICQLSKNNHNKRPKAYYLERYLFNDLHLKYNIIEPMKSNIWNFCSSILIKLLLILNWVDYNKISDFKGKYIIWMNNDGYVEYVNQNNADYFIRRILFSTRIKIKSKIRTYGEVITIFTKLNPHLLLDLHYIANKENLIRHSWNENSQNIFGRIIIRLSKWNYKYYDIHLLKNIKNNNYQHILRLFNVSYYSWRKIINEIEEFHLKLF